MANSNALVVRRSMFGTNPDAIETWAMDPPTFEALLKRLEPYQKVVLLSGDVHYSASAEMSYWKGTATRPARFVQFTSSGFKNVMQPAVAAVDRTAAFAQQMIRANLGMAMQGLAVVPMFAGYDLDRQLGRIFSYDVTGGCYEEHDHHSVGSGSLFARGALKKLWRPGLSGDDAVSLAVEALYDAADDDSATGGPDLGRRIWPTVAVVNVDGVRFVPDDALRGVVEAVIEARQGNPGGAR